MNKFLALAATVVLGGALLIAGCGSDNNKAASSGQTSIKNWCYCSTTCGNLRTSKTDFSKR